MKVSTSALRMILLPAILWALEIPNIAKAAAAQPPIEILLSLRSGRNHLLIKNTSRWEEHGFSFGVEGMHHIQDPWYYDINSHDLTDPDQAAAYIKAFKFEPTPIPMYSPATYKLDRSLGMLPGSISATLYDRRLQAPLTKKAGGAGLCRLDDDAPVFRSKSDPDYVRILQAIETGSERLHKFPRIDMMGKSALLDPNCIPDASVTRK